MRMIKGEVGICIYTYIFFKIFIYASFFLCWFFYIDVHSVFNLSLLTFQEFLIRTVAITINFHLKSSNLTCTVNKSAFHLVV